MNIEQQEVKMSEQVRPAPKAYQANVFWDRQDCATLSAQVYLVSDADSYIDALHAEAEALRAENGRLTESISVAHHNMGVGFDAEAELTCQLEAARGLLVADLQKLLPELDDALEDLELHGCHDQQGYRKLKDWFRKVEIQTRKLDAALSATPAPEVRPDLIRFDFINADGQPDSKMITHDEMRERYSALVEQGERQEAVATDALRKRFSEIEDEVARGKHNAMSCFTAMRTAALYIPKSMQNVLASLPKRQALSNLARDGELIASGWNACLDEFNRLNPSVEQVSSLLEWAVGRWEAEVSLRPLHNVHRRALDDTWRQVIRRIGGDDKALCGPAHDELLPAHRQAQQGDSHDT